jgi:hypothetical protein
MRAVLTGKLFHRPNTLAASLVPSNAAKTEGHARGNLLYTVAVGERTCWGHGGFLGTLAVYCPDVDLAVAINVDVSIDDKRFGGEEPETRLAGAIAAAVIPQIEKARNRAWHH